MDLGYAAEQAAIAAKNFHKALYKCFNKDYQELRKVSDPADLEENEHFFLRSLMSIIRNLSIW